MINEVEMLPVEQLTKVFPFSPMKDGAGLLGCTKVIMVFDRDYALQLAIAYQWRVDPPKNVNAKKGDIFFISLLNEPLTRVTHIGRGEVVKRLMN